MFLNRPIGNGNVRAGICTDFLRFEEILGLSMVVSSDEAFCENYGIGYMTLLRTLEMRGCPKNMTVSRRSIP